MTRIALSRTVTASPEVVWEALADLASHSEWMKDAESIEFRSEQRRGVGVEMEVETRVGPLRTLDIMTVTDWTEGESIEVRHEGLVTGVGLLSVQAHGPGSRISWDEDLRFPWWLGGVVTAWLARPILHRIWKGNLRRLDALVSGP